MLNYKSLTLEKGLEESISVQKTKEENGTIDDQIGFQNKQTLIDWKYLS